MAVGTWGYLANLRKRGYGLVPRVESPAQCARVYFESARSEFQSQQGLPGSRVDPVAEQSAGG